MPISEEPNGKQESKSKECHFHEIKEAWVPLRLALRMLPKRQHDEAVDVAGVEEDWMVLAFETDDEEACLQLCSRCCAGCEEG